MHRLLAITLCFLGRKWGYEAIRKFSEHLDLPGRGRQSLRDPLQEGRVKNFEASRLLCTFIILLERRIGFIIGISPFYRYNTSL